MSFRPTQPDYYDYLFKIIVIGDRGIGKTAFLTRYVDDTFRQVPFYPTGVDFRVRTLDHHGKVIKLQLWYVCYMVRFLISHTNNCYSMVIQHIYRSMHCRMSHNTLSEISPSFTFKWWELLNVNHYRRLCKWALELGPPIVRIIHAQKIV